jgi:hypothetical protein
MKALLLIYPDKRTEKYVLNYTELYKIRGNGAGNPEKGKGGGIVGHDDE